MTPGTIVYFKAAKNSMKRRDYAQYKGYGIGLLLGETPHPHAPDVGHDAVIKTMGLMGFFRIDDLEKQLGKEKTTEVTTQILAAYFPKPPEAPATEPNP